MNLNTINYVVFDKMIKRGTAKILENTESALFLYDTKSEGYYLACENVDLGMSILDKYVDESFNLMMVTNILIGEKAYEKYGFDGKYDCYQFAYYGKSVNLDQGFIPYGHVVEDNTASIELQKKLGFEQSKKLIRWMWK